jgi:transcriptional regulator
VLAIVRGVFDSRKYRPEDDALVERFLAAQRHATLIAAPPDASPQASILPYLLLPDGSVELHCVQADATFAAMRANPLVSLLVSDYLAYTPHHWVDPVDGSMSTLHFEAVLLRGTAELSTEPGDVAAALARLVTAFGHGPSYEPITDNSRYGPQLRRLAAVRVHVTERQAKFKTGQGTLEQRLSLTEHLRERAEPGDARAAHVIERAARERAATQTR